MKYLIERDLSISIGPSREQVYSRFLPKNPNPTMSKHAEKVIPKIETAIDWGDTIGTSLAAAKKGLVGTGKYFLKGGPINTIAMGLAADVFKRDLRKQYGGEEI